MAAVIRRVLAELGIISFWNSTTDAKLLCAQRFTRMFAYGGSTLILVSFLTEVGISTEMIGVFMTLTLVGDVVISLILTMFADGLGRKAILALGSSMMAGSGIVFALTSNYWILLLAAVFGVISPSGNEIGPFRAIEESSLAHITHKDTRSDIFAWYTLVGMAGQAFGMIVAGWSMNYMRTELEWDTIHVYRAVFWGYAVLGLLKLSFTLTLSKAVEAEKKKPHPLDQETAPLLGDGNAQPKPKKSSVWSLLPDISKDSKLITLNLCLLFAVDSFGSGLVPLSWVTYFFQTKFTISEGKLGTFFFVASLISAFSILVASSLAKRLGNIAVMVFTHLPSSIFLALIPVPNSLSLALTFLFLRASTQSMDTAPRTAFLAAVLRPNERTAIMGVINVVKTSAQTLSPSITGILANRSMFWVAFVLAGTMKSSYDLGMLAAFAGHKTVEDRDEEARLAAEAAE